jgi:hypothetical protein
VHLVKEGWERSYESWFQELNVLDQIQHVATAKSNSEAKNYSRGEANLLEDMRERNI